MRECGRCGGRAVWVWESVVLHGAGFPPRHIGCLDCGVMERNDGRRPERRHGDR